MPIDRATLRPYDPAQSPSNPVAPAPGWAKIAIALAGMLTTTLGTVLTVGLFPPDSTGAKLVAVAIAALGGVAPAVVFIIGESRKEHAAIEGAARVAVAEAGVEVAEAKAAEAEAKATGGQP